MALPSTFPIIPPTAPVMTGIIIGLAPTDPTFEMEIQRAPDSSGVAGTPVTIARIRPFPPGSGAHYTDRLPVTGTLYYYRHRHVRTGWTAGAWGPYSRAGTAKFLDGSNLPPASPVPFNPIPPDADGTVSDESVGTDGIIVLGPDGRDDLVFNGFCEEGLAYWQGAATQVSPLGAPIPVLASVNLAVDTATPFSGTKSLKFQAVTNGGVVQTVRPTDANAESAKPLFIKVSAADQHRVQIALKASSAATSVNVKATLFSDLVTQIGVAGMGTFVVGTSWAEFDISLSAIGSIPKYMVLGLEAPSHVDGRTIYFDKFRCTRLKSAADLGGTIAPAVVDGFTQDNVAASQTNVELARAIGRWRAVQAGSVTGVVATMSEARTAGTLTVTVFKNTGLAGAAGSSIGLTAVIDGTNTSRKATTQAKDLDTFAAGDELWIVVTTDGSWTPTTSDLSAALEVEV